MTDPATLLALAERCEQAAWPDQKAAMLAVVDALGLPSDQHYRAVRMIEIGAYESAALTLVPEGWRLGILSEWDDETLRKKGPWQSIVMPAGKGDNMGIGLKTRCDHAAKPALALCAAALRARAAMG
jgi:hypothetical protein